VAKAVLVGDVTYILLEDWAKAKVRTLGLARVWARTEKIEGALKLLDKDWIVPIDAEEPIDAAPREQISKPEALARATKLFRRIFFDAISRYEESARAGAEEPDRARWTKEEIMEWCKWPYSDDWRMLRSQLEAQVGLIMLRQGAGDPRTSYEQVKLWTFATCAEDREWGVINAVGSQVGAMKRTAKVTSLAIAPPDERHALDEGSKSRIEEVLERQNIKYDALMKSILDVKQDLLDRETMELLEAYGN